MSYADAYSTVQHGSPEARGLARDVATFKKVLHDPELVKQALRDAPEQTAAICAAIQARKPASLPDAVKQRLIDEEMIHRDVTVAEIYALVADARVVEMNHVTEVSDKEVIAKVALNAGTLGDLLNNALITVAHKDWWSPIGAVQLTLPDDGGLVLLSTNRHTLLRQDGKSFRHRPAIVVCSEPPSAGSGRSFSNVIAKTTAS